ncbi:MAG: hypothetical protein FWF31_11500 [Desulfobulbus sp.]|nr:hypothetical protein [Desulfobulbus sp.]
MHLLLFLGKLSLISGLLPLVMPVVYGHIGNFTPSCEPDMAAMLDGPTGRVQLFCPIPLLFCLQFAVHGGGFLGGVSTAFSAALEWKKAGRFCKE